MLLKSLFKQNIIIWGEYFYRRVTMDAPHPRCKASVRITVRWQWFIDFIKNESTYYLVEIM